MEKVGIISSQYDIGENKMKNLTEKRSHLSHAGEEGVCVAGSQYDAVAAESGISARAAALIERIACLDDDGLERLIEEIGEG